MKNLNLNIKSGDICVNCFFRKTNIHTPKIFHVYSVDYTSGLVYYNENSCIYHTHVRKANRLERFIYNFSLLFKFEFWIF